MYPQIVARGGLQYLCPEKLLLIVPDTEIRRKQWKSFQRAERRRGDATHRQQKKDRR